MNDHTEALRAAIATADNLIAEPDEGRLAYFLRSYFTNPISRTERRWIRRNVPSWVNFGQVNWAELARKVQA